MPTTNPEKNREYVKASNMKKKEQLIRTKGQEEGLKVNRFGRQKRLLRDTRPEPQRYGR